jgi:hypothetical protein
MQKGWVAEYPRRLQSPWEEITEMAIEKMANMQTLPAVNFQAFLNGELIWQYRNWGIPNA